MDDLVGARNREDAKQREERAAWLLERYTPFNVVMMPRFSKFDFILYSINGAVRTSQIIAEFRYRDVLPTQYDTIRITKEKVDQILVVAQHLDINRAWFLLQFSDESIWVADMFKFPGLPVVKDFKRNNQERPGDKPEDAYDIPITAFINWTDTKKASEDA